MAGTGRWVGVAALVVLGGLCDAAAASAQPPVVLHIDDRAAVPAPALAAAQTEVEQIFLAAGVEIAWATGRFPVSLMKAHVETPGSRHVAVIVLNHDESSSAGMVGCALGFAAKRSAAAYVLYNRVADASHNRAVDLAVVLGRVIAHEVGHVLLPPNSHAPHGIMRADLDLGLANPNRFTNGQARVLRAELASRSARD